MFVLYIYLCFNAMSTTKISSWTKTEINHKTYTINTNTFKGNQCLNLIYVRIVFFCGSIKPEMKNCEI